jgi:hypothetical protein
LNCGESALRRHPIARALQINRAARAKVKARPPIIIKMVCERGQRSVSPYSKADAFMNAIQDAAAAAMAMTQQTATPKI